MGQEVDRGLRTREEEGWTWRLGGTAYTYRGRCPRAQLQQDTARVCTVSGTWSGVKPFELEGCPPLEASRTGRTVGASGGVAESGNSRILRSVNGQWQLPSLAGTPPNTPPNMKRAEGRFRAYRAWGIQAPPSEEGACLGTYQGGPPCFFPFRFSSHSTLLVSSSSCSSGGSGKGRVVLPLTLLPICLWEDASHAGRPLQVPQRSGCPGHASACVA